MLVLHPVNFGAVSALSITTTDGSYFKIQTLLFVFVTDTGADCQQFLIFCKVVLLHCLLGVLSVVSHDKCCSKLADKRGC